MLVSTAVAIFNVLQDKFASPNVNESEILKFFNMAIGEYLNRVFPDNEGGSVNFEYDSNVTANLQPLIYTVGPLNMNSSGILTSTVINSALVSVTSEVGATYFRIANIGWNNVQPARYAKLNNILAYIQNAFKAPTITNPYYTVVATGFQFYPTSISTPISVTVIKTPKQIVSTSDTFEFSDYVVYNIISIALKLSGCATRDQEMLEDIRLAGLQINQ